MSWAGRFDDAADGAAATEPSPLLNVMVIEYRISEWRIGESTAEPLWRWMLNYKFARVQLKTD